MKKNQKQSYIGWYVLTGVIILFALFAPFLFTRPGVIDFSEFTFLEFQSLIYLLILM